MIKTMLGMEKADEGEALVLNHHMPNRHILGEIGYMAQSDALYETLSGLENMEFFAQMKGLTKIEIPQAIDHATQVVDLSEHLNKSVAGYSGGMKRRLSLAIALLGNPRLLILDEPTVGIDPALRRKVWKELRQLKKDGVGILVTTHVMDEAELTDKVAEKLLKKYQGKLPRKALQDKILQALINKGFTHNQAKIACQHLEFEEDEERQQELLYKEIDKQYSKYSKKYEGYDLKQRLTQALARKGFDYSDITSALREYL